MTQEQKELLLKDLCSRLPYGVKCEVIKRRIDGEMVFIRNGPRALELTINDFKELVTNNLYEIKPYLFPLSSMTEEQKKYINDRWGVNENFDFEIDPNWGKYFVELCDVVDFINWCYENHLDINRLIPKDLVIDATDLNIY